MHGSVTAPACPCSLRILLVCALMLLFGACDKSGGYEYSAVPGGAGADEVAFMDGGGFSGHAFEDDDISGEVLSPEGAALSSRARSKHSSLISTRGEFSPGDAEGTSNPDPVADASEVETPTEAKPKPEPARPATPKRQVIYTATLQISVYQVNLALDTAEALPERLGGWIQTRNDNLVVLRIPAQSLQDAIAMLSELGVVDSRTLEALDVTDKYTDLESRIRVLAETQAQLQKLLDQAKTVEQALKIRRSLDEVTLELELARARMRSLAESIAFSTLVVRFVARTSERELPSSNDPFPWVVGLGVESTEFR